MPDFLGGDYWHVVNLLALISYILIKELVLDRKQLKDRLNEVQNRKDPLKALEIDLGKISQKVINLEDAISDQGDALSAKLDMILTDFKEKHIENRESLNEMRKDFTEAHRALSERLAAVEVELRLKPNRRK